MSDQEDGRDDDPRQSEKNLDEANLHSESQEKSKCKLSVPPYSSNTDKHLTASHKLVKLNIPRERKKWSRPGTAIGQGTSHSSIAESNTSDQLVSLEESSTRTDENRVISCVSHDTLLARQLQNVELALAAYPYEFSESESSVSSIADVRAPSTCSASSAASARPLEWDSGADVGYQNLHNYSKSDKELELLELFLTNQSAAPRPVSQTPLKGQPQDVNVRNYSSSSMSGSIGEASASTPKGGTSSTNGIYIPPLDLSKMRDFSLSPQDRSHSSDNCIQSSDPSIIGSNQSRVQPGTLQRERSRSTSSISTVVLKEPVSGQDIVKEVPEVDKSDSSVELTQYERLSIGVRYIQEMLQTAPVAERQGLLKAVLKSLTSSFEDMAPVAQRMSSEESEGVTSAGKCMLMNRSQSVPALELPASEQQHVSVPAGPAKEMKPKKMYSSSSDLYNNSDCQMTDGDLKYWIARLKDENKKQRKIEAKLEEFQIEMSSNPKSSSEQVPSFLESEENQMKIVDGQEFNKSRSEGASSNKKADKNKALFESKPEEREASENESTPFSATSSASSLHSSRTRSEERFISEMVTTFSQQHHTTVRDAIWLKDVISTLNDRRMNIRERKKKLAKHKVETELLEETGAKEEAKEPAGMNFDTSVQYESRLHSKHKDYSDSTAAFHVPLYKAKPFRFKHDPEDFQTHANSSSINPMTVESRNPTNSLESSVLSDCVKPYKTVGTQTSDIPSYEATSVRHNQDIQPKCTSQAASKPLGIKPQICSTQSNPKTGSKNCTNFLETSVSSDKSITTVGTQTVPSYGADSIKQNQDNKPKPTATTLATSKPTGTKPKISSSKNQHSVASSNTKKYLQTSSDNLEGVVKEDSQWKARVAGWNRKMDAKLREEKKQQKEEECESTSIHISQADMPGRSVATKVHIKPCKNERFGFGEMEFSQSTIILPDSDLEYKLMHDKFAALPAISSPDAVTSLDNTSINKHVEHVPMPGGHRKKQQVTPVTKVNMESSHSPNVQKKGSNKKNLSFYIDPQNQMSARSMTSLQECLQQNNPKFIRHSSKRQQTIDNLTVQRKERKQLRRDYLLRKARSDAAGAYIPGCLPPSALRNCRLFTRAEMLELNKKVYKNLPEVQQSREYLKKQKEKRVNRQMAEMFNKKMKNKVVRKGKTDFSNSDSMLSPDTPEYSDN